MCVNYRPTRAELLEAMTGASPAHLGSWKEEVWQDYQAPIMRAGPGGERELLLGSYGMIPKDKIPAGVPKLSTMNARAETVGEKRSYSKQWRQAQTCLLPTEWFYEPNWETGKAERWAIGMADGEPFCIAGLWRSWEEEQGFRFSFTQLTLNATDHPLMKRFHKPADEKRSLVIVPRLEWDAWLNAGDPEVARSMLNLYPAELMKAWPAAKGYGGKSKRSVEAAYW